MSDEDYVFDEESGDWVPASKLRQTDAGLAWWMRSRSRSKHVRCTSGSSGTARSPAPHARVAPGGHGRAGARGRARGRSCPTAGATCRRRPTSS